MRKIKKINGYLVVKFNDREKRSNEGTGLGEYGVIDAELYTGHLDIDRGEMEYDGAGTLEEAVELARGLESEMDITEQPPTYTVSTETDESYTEEEVDPQLLINGWESTLQEQVKSDRHPEMTPSAATHELHGFKTALYHMGLLDGEELTGARRVLRAAAMTYVAALLMSALQLLRFVLAFSSRRRD